MSTCPAERSGHHDTRDDAHSELRWAIGQLREILEREQRKDG